MSTPLQDLEKPQGARFEDVPTGYSGEKAIDGHTLGPASTHDTEKQSTSGYAPSLLGEDHKKGLARAERKLLTKLGESFAILSCASPLTASSQTWSSCHCQRVRHKHFDQPCSLADVTVRSPATGLYLSAYLDRGNLGNARLQGLQEEALDGDDSKYSLALACFFITYIVLSIPGTLLAKVSLSPEISSREVACSHM